MPSHRRISAEPLQLRIDKIIDICRKSGAQVRFSWSERRFTQTRTAGCPSRLWISERECRFCGATRTSRHCIHWPTGVSHCQHGLQKVRPFGDGYDFALCNRHLQRVQDDHVQYVRAFHSAHDQIVYVLYLDAGVPVVPGYHGSNQDANFLAEEANKIGQLSILPSGIATCPL